VMIWNYLIDSDHLKTSFSYDQHPNLRMIWND
jgi:hypothetical protein